MSRSNRLLALLLVLGTATMAVANAHANPYELELQLVGAGSAFQPIEIRNTTTGALVGNYQSRANSTFEIDFNGTAGADVSLSPDVQYTFIFKTWNKACYVEGSMPPGQTNYDDAWRIDTNSNTVSHLTGPGLQTVWGFPNATYWTPLALTLAIESTQTVGDKTSYWLRGTATGGNGSYTFAWTNVGAVLTAPTVNPSRAVRTILNSSSATVTCTVTSGSSSVQRQILLSRF